MANILLRWTFGETNARKTSPQAWEMLECSLKFARLLFADADLVVCYNNLSEKVEKILEKISRENSAGFINVSEILPPFLRNTKIKNSWWKYSPVRMSAHKYEIVMDNDIVLWKLPPTLLQAIQTRSLVALTDAMGQYYGDFSDVVLRSDPELRLNAGLIGMPEGYVGDLEKLRNKVFSDFFHSEQGFTAASFLDYKGRKFLIPLDEVPQLNALRVDPEELVPKYCGAHFCGCSYGHYDYWEKSYALVVKDRLSRMTEQK